MPVTAMRITSRPVVDADLPLLRAIYQSTRRDELVAVGWTDAAIETFSNQQFELQQRHYDVAYRFADHRIIVIDGIEAGQVLVHRADSTHTLVDIALTSEHRGRGAGTAIMNEIIDDADRAAATLELSVLNHNPARRLYARLGFEAIESDEIRTNMRRSSVRKDTT